MAVRSIIVGISRLEICSSLLLWLLLVLLLVLLLMLAMLLMLLGLLLLLSNASIVGLTSRCEGMGVLIREFSTTRVFVVCVYKMEIRGQAGLRGWWNEEWGCD